MTGYRALADRLAANHVVILDGAIGTQLQEYGVPMDNTAWAATALETHPATVRHMHAEYVKAGCDIITTNTYSAARHNLEPLGLGERVLELNLRAVQIAQDARDKAAGQRDVWIAGTISGFGIQVEGEGKRSLHRHSRPRTEITADQARANLREQAEALAEAGVDLLFVESTGSMAQRAWIVDACKATGLPVWAGFRCRLDTGDPMVKVGYESDVPFTEGLKAIVAKQPDAVMIFHSLIEHTGPAIDIALAGYDGPVAAYPEADRPDYTATLKDHSLANKVSPEEYVAIARDWVAQGVQIIGGCCGIGLPYIRPLRDALPPTAGRRLRAAA